MVSVVTQGRREPLRAHYYSRYWCGCGSDLFFWNLKPLHFGPTRRKENMWSPTMLPRSRLWAGICAWSTMH